MNLSLELESTPEAPHSGRQAIREQFADRLPSEMLHDLALIVSELIANSVTHARGDALKVSIVIRDDGSVRGEIEDGGDPGDRIPEILDHSDGLGLRIVDAIARRWGVYEGTTHVWFELPPYPLPPQAA